MAHFPLDSLASKTTEGRPFVDLRGEGTQVVGRKVGYDGLDKAEIACLFGLFDEFVGQSGLPFLLEGFQLLVEFLGFGLHLGDAFGQFMGLAGKLTGQLIDSGDPLVGPLVGGETGHGFDPAGACGNGGFADDPQGTDLPAEDNAGASAKFLAPSAEVDHPHGFAVLVAEESDDVVRFFGKRRFVGFEGIVREELLVGYPFDFGKLLGFDSFEMGKVKAPSGRVPRASRLGGCDRPALREGPSGGRGCGVVPLDGFSSLEVYVEDGFLPCEIDLFRLGLELMQKRPDESLSTFSMTRVRSATKTDPESPVCPPISA